MRTVVMVLMALAALLTAGQLIQAAESPVGTAASDRLAELPLVEVKPSGAARDILAVIITGDGGWAEIDQALATGLSRAGIGVVGLNALKYFWTARSPEVLATHLNLILDHYLAAWNKPWALLIGYSLGADVMPFAVNRLTPKNRARICAVVLLAPGRRTAFEFHIAGWFGGGNAEPFAVQPEIERMAVPRILCAYGAEDSESVCPQPDGQRIAVLKTRGAHHFGGDYDALVKAILALPLP